MKSPKSAGLESPLTKVNGEEKEDDEGYMVIVEEGYRPANPVSHELGGGKYYEVAKTNDCNQRVKGLSMRRRQDLLLVGPSHAGVSSFPTDKSFTSLPRM